MSYLKDKQYTDIAQLGHPVLKTPAQVVTEIQSDECQDLILKMMITVEQAGGVGIAAPQIFNSKRIFIMCSKPNARYPDAPLMEPTAIINPEIIEASIDKEKGWEGCLSVPSIRGLVPRHKQIKVKYYDQTGQEHHAVFTDFIARVFQHELDHLDGLTFVDRVESVQDLVSESYWYAHFAPKG
ncbi:peptide deformylase [Pseudoalteromonas luteoviolacea]|uniref:Peptide deformylase n=1 Tax=Pseudoalteromonas luteoviolacea TaxID=43657 RepID=A0A1C0TJ18_9GAMM|nr:peptide deformylase [Pseudoalteromonas luteoviolacea]OCQ18308.1 peptide deformylase [Pseudoalteromonas luteoviolacea]